MGALLIWCIFEIKDKIRSPYIGVIIISILSIAIAKYRWMAPYKTEEFGRKSKERTLKFTTEYRKNIRMLIAFPIIFIIGMILFGIFLNLSRQEYLNSLILFGAELFFITILLFEIRNRQNIIQTIVLIGSTVIYFAILFLIFN